ncbi:vacuolar protein sorting-associated protein 16 [Viridothelium virens]|uniref:Probable vacuolar protein sorting-associated protein 16 homolog n=1 Tax=Viridothelium virens TaxID=1048519 RepID=A0A6A6HLK6_VIRVR|nr:vacuolar protein sorting-associated protein 16 [Viridothelium virens]
MSVPTSEWERVGDRFYRKIPLYQAVFDQDLELENYIVVGAPLSGAVAIYRDDQKVHTLRAPTSGKAGISIYSSSGKLIRHISWDKGSIKALGWSEDEQLLIVTSDGSVRCYHDLQGDFVPFTLGNGAEEHGVLECRFWSSGFVALLGNNTLVAVSNYDEPRPKLLAKPPTEHVVSWAIIPPSQSLSLSVEVLLAVRQTIYVIDISESEDRMLQRGPFDHISISENGKFVALYTEDGKVWVISSDFQNKLSEYDTQARTRPRAMEWCGNNAVVLAWEDEVHIVGPNASNRRRATILGLTQRRFFYDNWVHLIPDIDGVRILTNDVCEFLQKVPDVVEDTFRLGSTSSSSVLVDAARQLENQSPKADDSIKLIRPVLDEAVDACIKAAGHEYRIPLQKQLLKAASFGKSVLDLYNSDDFVDMCELLRVLNAIRFYEIGLPISYDQFLRLTPERLVKRLINRSEYLLALRISDYLHLSTERIYVHWASQKVRLSTDNDEETCRLIVERLKGKVAVSYEEIAKAAFDEGRAQLATGLLNQEPRAGKQVPLLLNMEEDSIALDKAIESGDTDLILYVLLHMKKKLPLATFFRTINTRPLATAMIETLALEQDRDLAKDLYYQDDRRIDGSNLSLLEALRQKEPGPKADKLKAAGRLLQDSKENTFQAKAIDEAQKLIKVQTALDTELDVHLSGLSVNETIFELIRIGSIKRAQKMQSDFKVPDKTYWWIRLRALVAKRDWTELEEIGKNRRSPIGWEPFFNDILSAGNTRLASVFIPKCTALPVTERIEMWLKCGLVVKAAEEASRAKDMESLEMLRGRATGNAALEVERLMSQVTPQKRR